MRGQKRKAKVAPRVYRNCEEFWDDYKAKRSAYLLTQWYGLGPNRVTKWIQSGDIHCPMTGYGYLLDNTAEARLIDLILSARRTSGCKGFMSGPITDECLVQRRDDLLAGIGVRQLKKVRGLGVDLSRKRIEEELSWSYEEFIEKKLKVRTKAGKRVAFVLHAWQREYCRRRTKARKEGRQFRMWMLKARQIGSSTIRGACLAKDLLANPGSRAAIIADRLAVARNIARRYVFAPLAELCEEYDIPIKPFSNATDSPSIIMWPDDEEKRTEVWILTANQGDKTGRSLDFQFLLASEVAYFSLGTKNVDENQADEVFASIMQCIPDYWEAPQAALDVESTARGAYGKFYEGWCDAEKGTEGWEPMFVPWWGFEGYEIPGEYTEQDRLLEAYRGGDEKAGVRLNLDELEQVLVKSYPMTWAKLAWRRQTIKVKCDGNVAKFKENYPSNAIEAFIVSGASVFDPASIEHYQKNGVETGNPMMFVPDPKVVNAFTVEPFVGFDPDLTVYRLPDRKLTYVIGGDVSLGAGSVNGAEGAARNSQDLSVLDVWCVETLEQVATYAGRPEPMDLGDVAYKLGIWYNKAAVNIERNGWGLVTINRLIQLRYPALYMYTRQMPNFNWSDPVVGTPTDKTTRPMMLSNLRQAVLQRYAKFHNGETLREMMRFTAINGRYDHVKSGHDDYVFGCAMAWQVLMDKSPLFAGEKEFVGAATDEERAQAYMRNMGASAWDGRIRLGGGGRPFDPILLQ